LGKPRVIFLGNSESVFSNRHFATLIEPWIEVVAVVDTPPAMRTSTNPDRGNGLRSFTEIARMSGAPVFEPDDPNSADVIREIRGLNPDILIAVGYVKLLSPSVLDIPRLVAANFHASLLPAYRGKHPVFWALRNGERSAGLTVHVMDPHIDTGDILYQVEVRTRRRDSTAALYSRIMDRSVPLVPRLIREAVEGKLLPKKQNIADASYFSSTAEDDFRLTWHADGEMLRRWICTTPGKCWFAALGRTVYVQDAEMVRGIPVASVGTIIQIDRVYCAVAVNGGTLRLRSGCTKNGPLESMSTILGRLKLAVGNSLD
jgi:methionyl-tRNA formyltransferase